MKQLKNRIVRVWKSTRIQIEERLLELKNRARLADDTVEAQAQTFRIWMWSSAAGLTLIVLVSVLSLHTDNAEKPAAEAPRSMLDRLPEGFVVAPIDPVNLDSLDSIFEDHGYADIYKAAGRSDTNSKGRRLARGLPLIRAPRNPRRFAVLVRETDSEILADLNEPVLVVLRKGPLKMSDKREPRHGRPRRDSPLFREPHGNIHVIEEEIPESAQVSDGGVKS